MKNKSKRILLTLLLGTCVALMATGCSSLKKEEETEAETEAPTEAVIETELPTEIETETETETETESETETEAAPQYTTDTTSDEEEADLSEYDNYVTMYAADDLNVRERPGTDSDTFYSFSQGDPLEVMGETPNWYQVSVEEYETSGFVYKEYVVASEDEVYEGSASSDEEGSSDEGEASASSSDVDAEYGVEPYSEEFPIRSTAGANMRSTPSQDGDIIDVIASDTTVTAIGYTDSWYKVSYDGEIGYVNMNLFSED